MPDLPSDRASHCSAVVGKCCFLVGGYGNKTIDKYDLVTKTVTTVASMKTHRFEFGMCLHKSNQILVAGGCTYVDPHYSRRAEACWSADSCFLFNTATNSLKEVGSMNSKRRGPALVNCEGDVYAIGGIEEREELTSIEKFDSITETWTTVADLNIGRRMHRAVAHKHFIYVFGGEKTVGFHREPLNSIEKIDTRTNSVELLNVTLFSPRCLFAVAPIASQVYILGGTDISKLETFEIFDLEQQTFSKG